MTRVLVVHHDLDMADIEVDGLRRAGYEVDQCAGPIGGSPCPVLHGERCWQVEAADVLVYDVWASGDTGQDLIDDLRDLHPNKPVVLTSPGMMLNWAEKQGPHSVTPVAWAPSEGNLADAVEAAIEANRTVGTDAAPTATPKDPPKPARRPGPSW